MNLNYNGVTVEVVLLNSERGLWYDGRCGCFKKFESAHHFRVESESQVPNLTSTIQLGRTVMRQSELLNSVMSYYRLTSYIMLDDTGICVELAQYR